MNKTIELIVPVEKICLLDIPEIKRIFGMDLGTYYFPVKGENGEYVFKIPQYMADELIKLGISLQENNNI